MDKRVFKFYYTEKVQQTVPSELQRICWEIYFKERFKKHKIPIIQHFDFLIRHNEVELVHWQAKPFCSKRYVIRSLKRIDTLKLIIIDYERPIMALREEVGENFTNEFE